MATYKGDFLHGIHKDPDVLGDNTYIGNRQGCGTVWFKDVPTARKALIQDGGISGKDLVHCRFCNGYYSTNDPMYEKYPDHLCSKTKEKYAEHFE